MTKLTCFVSLLLLCISSTAQNKLDKLTVDKIMRDPKWIGSSPSGLQWSYDGQYLFFNWNPDNAPADSSYFITRDNKTPQKTTVTQRLGLLTENNVTYNQARTAYVYSKD